ncbi:hypothetical protein [Alteribacter natronophilus]|uniref:hypothetical protein n=1 Tax=Alteribacter natronophilus TaxID=2583810 RepID=UPI00110E6E97|nr:hypothetical protein [Alteribacter natronophilus]TMW73571.1 hypothetical protein FGB90_04535 [Alteribacter natronophilus]
MEGQAAEKEALRIIEVLASKGYQACIAGGAVRDLLLDRIPADIDVATDAAPKEVMKLFPAAIDVGAAHGTVLIPAHDGTVTEVTRFKSVSGSTGSLKEDLSLRDFTVNAMAKLKDGTIIDPYGGREDLKKGMLRAVGSAEDRILEDPVRLLRAVRFAVRYSFEWSSDLRAAVEKHAALLSQPAFERKSAELEKMLGNGLSHENFVYFLKSAPAAGLSPLFTYRKLWLEKLEQSPAPFPIEGKPLFWYTASWHPDPAVSSRALTKAKRSTRLKKAVSVIHEVNRRLLSEGWTSEVLYLAGADLLVPCERLRALWKAGIPDEHGVTEKYQQLPIKTKKELAVNGRILIDAFNTDNGKWVGRTLKHAEMKVVNSELPNDRDAILDYIRKLC